MRRGDDDVLAGSEPQPTEVQLHPTALAQPRQRHALVRDADDQPARQTLAPAASSRSINPSRPIPRERKTKERGAVELLTQRVAPFNKAETMRPLLLHYD